MSLIDFAAARVADSTSKGVHSSPKNKALTADVMICQQGACWLCGEELDGSVELDRLATGRALGFDCLCADHCRCGYLPGNVAAAHRTCHAGSDPVRGMLRDDEIVSLASRFVATREDVERARFGRRAARGSAVSAERARRLEAARGRAERA